MGSKRFYEHAQNLLGGVKGKWAIFKLRAIGIILYDNKLYYDIIL